MKSKYASMILVIGVCGFFIGNNWALSKTEESLTASFNDCLKDAFFIGDDMKLCECGCGQEIISQYHHKYYGIPRFIRGHQNKGKNNPMYGTYRSGANNPLWKRVKRNCEYCGKEFYVKPSILKIGSGRFCSRKCIGKWRSKNFIGENNTNWQRIKVKCKYCNKNFFAKLSALKIGSGKFCSRECQGKWKSENSIGIDKSEYFKQYRKTPAGKANIKANRHNRRTLEKDLTREMVQRVYKDNITKYGVLTCYLCGKPIVDNDDCLEHSTPLSRGGTNNYNNLGIAHQSCNNQKYTKTLDEYYAKKRN